MGRERGQDRVTWDQGLGCHLLNETRDWEGEGIRRSLGQEEEEGKARGTVGGGWGTRGPGWMSAGL